MKGTRAIAYQAEAMAWLAKVIARRNSKEAVALIDRALSLLLDSEPSFALRNHAGGVTGAAARVAYCARLAGYPDMDSVIARVLATRLPPDAYAASEMDLSFSMESAPALLALTDRTAAAEMVRQITSGQGSLPRPDARGIGNRWLLAWGLADLQHARGAGRGRAGGHRRDSELSVAQTG